MTDNTTETASFFRYIRPIDPRTGFPDSSKGTCLNVRMDYNLRKMYVSAAVCDGDNFSKELAKTLTTQRMNAGEYFQFGLDDFADSDMGLVEYVVNTLHDIQSELSKYNANPAPAKHTSQALAFSIIKQAKQSSPCFRL